MSKTALVTGGSKGIGFELSKLLAQDGYKIILIARNYDDLQSAEKTLQNEYNAETYLISKDLSNRTAPKEVFEEVKANGMEVDILINNAGFGTYGYFFEIDLEKEYKMLDLNVTSLMGMTKLFLNDMLERDYGKILNVSSIAGFLPGPLFASYSASKAFVSSFTQAVNAEIKDKSKNITLTTLYPTFVRTSFQKDAGMGELNENSSAYELPASTVAKMGYEGLKYGKREVVAAPLSLRLILSLSSFLPRNLVLNWTKNQMK